MRVVLLALSLIMAVALMGFGPNPQTIEELLGQAPPGRAAGRAAIGLVADPSTGEGDSAVMGAVMNGAIGRVVTIQTEAGPVQLIVDENTRITSPSGTDRVLERIAEGLPVRIAVVADRLLVDGDGTPIAEAAVARQLTIIPIKATREHRRVIVAEKGTAAKATALDEDGNSIQLEVDPNGAAVDGQVGIGSSFASEIPEQGESAVLLVRRGGDDDKGERVTAVVNTRRVAERLSDLAGNSKLQGDDPFRSARLEAALERHQSDIQVRLQKVLDRAQDRFKEVVTRAVDQAKIKVEQRQNVRGVVSGLDPETVECVRGILGRVPVTKKGIPPGQFRRVEVQCLEREVELELTIEPSSSSADVGDTITITLRRDEPEPGVSLDLVINGEPQTPDEVTRTSARLDYTVPRGVSELIIQARTTNREGRTTSASRVLKIRQDPPPRVEFKTPGPREVLVAGSSYRFTTHSEDNGDVVSVDLFVNGERYSTEEFEVEGATRGRVRGADGRIYGPVHNGALVPIPQGAASVTVRAVATDNVGNIGTTTRLFRVGSDAAPTVSITSPKEGTELRAGESITVEVIADDNGEVVSVTGSVTESGGRTALVFEEFPQMDWRSNPFTVPEGQDSLTIEVTATDDQGNTGTTTEAFRVTAGTGPTVSITSPVRAAEVDAGQSLVVQVLADDNGEVSSVAGSVTESGVRTPLVFEEFPQMDWRSNSYVVRGGATSFGAPDTSVLPHFFTGTVTLDGVTALDGTRVAATIERAIGAVVSIEVTATDDNGNTATTTREFKLRPSGVELISGVVSGGTFSLLLEQPLGESFGGEEIKFTVGGQEAAQSSTWEFGGVSELNLSAGVGR